jgi:hypothetical protein
MKITDYEKTYVSVTNAISDTKYLEAVVEFLHKQSEPVTCATIGEAVFGDEYHGYYMGKSYQGMMGQMLRHLRQGGFIKMEEHKGTPIEYEKAEYIRDSINNEPPSIIVYDKQGREYTIANPNYVASDRGHWEMVKKTVTPTIKTYIWVA